MTTMGDQMEQEYEQFKLPCTVLIDNHVKDPTAKCIINIPDLNMDVKGSNFAEAMSMAVELVTALYYYYVERNLPFSSKYTWEYIDKVCRGNDKFPTYVVVID